MDAGREGAVRRPASPPHEVPWDGVGWGGKGVCLGPPRGRKCEVQGPEMEWTVLQVKHLEVSSASMAEDLCRKSAIIETYVMDSRIGQCSFPSPPLQCSLHLSPLFHCPMLLLLSS